MYIYMDSKKKNGNGHAKISPITLAKDFIFVWVLFGLLALYIVSIHIKSAVLFAAGNIFIEVFLVVYTVKSRTEKSDRK